MPNTEQSILETGGVPEIELDMEVFGMMQYPVDKTLTVSEMAADAKATGDAIATVQEAVSDNSADIADIQAWTGEDIPLSTSTGMTSIADAFNNVIGVTYPIGSIYMTTSSSAPQFAGEWEEILITATWTQLKTGKRGYETLAEGDTGGSVHFWRRVA